MNKILKLIQGNREIGTWLMMGLGYIGIFQAVNGHTSVWSIITLGDDVIKNKGEFPVFIIILLAVILLLLVLRSVYVLLPVIAYLLYVVETVVGGHFLRFMPFKITKLTPAVYAQLPVAVLLMLVGSIGVIVLKKRVSN